MRLADQLPSDPTDLTVHFETGHAVLHGPATRRTDEWTFWFKAWRSTQSQPDIGQGLICRIRERDRGRAHELAEDIGGYAPVLVTELFGPPGAHVPDAGAWPTKGGDLLIIDSIELHPEWRDFGLESILLGEALDTLARPDSVIAARPGVDDETPGTPILHAVGLNHFRGGVYACTGADLSLRLLALRRRLRAMGEEFATGGDKG